MPLVYTAIGLWDLNGDENSIKVSKSFISMLTVAQAELVCVINIVI